jgi:hypothetical protein
VDDFVVDLDNTIVDEAQVARPAFLPLGFEQPFGPEEVQETAGAVKLLI